MISAIIEGARIFEGTSRPPYVTDIGLVGDRIALIGDLSDRDADERIDGRGAGVWRGAGAV